ncbi:hypothetical protein SAMN05444392_101565 [Seinonella peptonophila]|uniref:Protein kinase domain-containing protein n=1 Tax=Seinonella peptonophila TaxID=112248 RepID=A0A1M4TNY8_9BACL|nr:hypothetical protein [Seinonella peptonophila]SHE46210.1 hypothetical protein SAMN05444392_101565 [Seinonella peptonophila]
MLHSQYDQRFFVEDVIDSITGQLIQARSLDGTSLCLQKIPLYDLTIKEMSLNQLMQQLQHPYIVPILDMILEDNQLILVHPPNTGEPLLLEVNPNRPMELYQAMQFVLKVLQVIVYVKETNLPLHIACDPKKILVREGDPLLLFFSVEHLEEEHESWRKLLPFLLTGQFYDSGVEDLFIQLKVNKIPSSISKLIKQVITSKMTMQTFMEILNDYLDEYWKKTIQKQPHWKWVVLCGVFMMFIFIVKSTSTYHTCLPQQDKANDHFYTNPAWFDLRNRDREYQLPVGVDRFSRITGSFSMGKGSTFYFLLQSKKDKEKQYGLTVSSNGRIILYQRSGKRQLPMLISSEFRVKPRKIYHYIIEYERGKPLAVQLQESGSKLKWIGIGTLPIASSFIVRIEGKGMVVVKQPRTELVKKRVNRSISYLYPTPWRLVFGQGKIMNNKTVLFPGSTVEQLHLKKSFMIRPVTMQYPFSINLLTTDHQQWKAYWNAKSRLELFYLQEQLKKMAVKKTDWIQQGSKLIKVHIYTTHTRSMIQFYDGNEQKNLTYSRQIAPIIQRVTLNVEGKTILY